MWVLLKKTYVGEFGIFLKNLKYDLPKATIKRLRGRLGKKNVIETSSPWDEHKEKKQSDEREKESPQKTGRPKNADQPEGQAVSARKSGK